MPEFVQAIAEAIAAARTDLERARSEGDVDDVLVHQGRLEELRRIAADHGVSAA
jgi:hypothetical protein